jgi:hypothetical protein
MMAGIILIFNTKINKNELNHQEQNGFIGMRFDQ